MIVSPFVDAELPGLAHSLFSFLLNPAYPPDSEYSRVKLVSHETWSAPGVTDEEA